MAQTSDSPTKFIEKKKKYLSTKLLFILFFIISTIIVAYSSKKIYLTNTQEYKERIYSKVNIKILKEFRVMLEEKKRIALLVVSALSKENKIKDALLTRDKDIIDMDRLLEDMKTKKEYVNIQVEIIDANGISFKRSWIDKSGDDLVKDDPRMAHLIKYPRVVTDIKATSYGLNITSMTPVYNKGVFLGFFVVNMHFDSFLDIFTEDGFNSIILLNEKDSSLINQDVSYSNLFIDKCYVVNRNVDKYLVKILKENDLKSFCKEWDKEYKINKQSDHLVSKYYIEDSKGILKSTVFIFKSLDDIDLEDLEVMQEIHITATVIFIIMLGFMTIYVYSLKRTKELSIENDELIVINEELKVKTDEMDFQDKKMENMFNSQPNLMIMHNGTEVIQGNKRFMGFFNRFGDFAGFRKKHKCVSELFEKYEAPNYIYDQEIDGMFWVDYILANPKRLYKTVMSYRDSKTNEPHHFIIKLNEMRYAKHVSERVIIIALVDMTQDLVNYKTIGDTSSQQVSLPVKNDETIAQENMQPVKKEVKKLDEYKKLDLNSLIEDSSKDMFQSLLSENVRAKKLEDAKLYELKDKHCVRYDNIYKIGDLKLNWILLITAQTLSIISNIKNDDEESMILDTIDSKAKRLAEDMMKEMKILINKKTKEKVELISSPIEVIDKLLFDYSSVLLKSEFSLKSQKFEFYILLEGN